MNNITELQLSRLKDEVKKMRNLQKQYFRTRDKTVLSESKNQEKIIDQMIEDLEMLSLLGTEDHNYGS